MGDYGHAERLARIVAARSEPTGGAAASPVGPPGPRSDAQTTAPPIDPALYDRPDVRRILAERDITGLFRVIKRDAGLTQRTIAELTGMNQSEVSEILDGRRVIAYDVLVRIAQGLGVPRERMGLSYDASDAYGGGVTVANPLKGVDVEMLRRRLIELGAGIALGAPAAKLAPLLERLELPDPSPGPLPSRLSGVHVMQVQDLTRQLGEAGRIYGSDPALNSAAAAWASKLLDIPGSESVRRALMVAVAELHIRVGWAGFDGGLYDRAMVHYARGLKLATEAGDAYCQALSLNCAGLATVEHGDPNEGLKLLQVGTVTAQDVPTDRGAVVVGEGSRAALQACASADSATALGRLGYPEAPRLVDTALAKARELWRPTSTDPGGDLDRPAAVLELERGRLDAAEPFAVASMRRWEGGSRVDRTQSAIVLSVIHVRAGEQRGLQLAHSAIAAADKLTSVRARKRLVPLVAALESRPGSDYRELARTARQIAATRT